MSSVQGIIKRNIFTLLFNIIILLTENLIFIFDLTMRGNYSNKPLSSRLYYVTDVVKVKGIFWLERKHKYICDQPYCIIFFFL